MRHCALLATALLAASSGFAADSPAAAPEVIPPVERAARHFEEGEKYLRSLPDGTKVTVTRLDGSTFTLALSGGKFTITLPASQVSENGKLFTSPLGFQVFVNQQAQPPGLAIVAPGGSWTTFSFVKSSVLLAMEQHGGLWSTHLELPLTLRLPDGTRIDMMDSGRRWEVMTLNGERYRLVVAEGTWTALPQLPSPPLVPDMDSFYVAGNGDNWRKPAQEDHIVFAWNWYPVGFSLAQAIEDVRGGVRRADLDGYFNVLANPQSGADMGACLLGRRLALGGGDQVTFKLPNEPPVTVLLLPGPIEPNYLVLKETLLKHMRPRTVRAPTVPE